jgi:hypothetical protein
MTVDLGASFVHYPMDGNSINDAVTQLHISTIPANFDTESVFSVNGSRYSAADLAASETVFNQLLSFVLH